MAAGGAEIDDHIARTDAGRRIVADVDRGADAQAEFAGRGAHRPAHAAARAIEKNGERHGPGSYWVNRARVWLSEAKLAALISQSGSRTSGEPMRPAAASAALMGTGLVSRKSALNKG